MAQNAGFENGEPIFDDEKHVAIQPLHANEALEEVRRLIEELRHYRNPNGPAA